MDALRLYGGQEDPGLPELYFARLPVEMLADGRLTGAHVKVAAAIVSHCPVDCWSCWPGNKNLAAMTGLTRRGVQLAIAALESAGWITRSVQTGRRPPRLIHLAWRTPRPATKPKGKAHGGAPQGERSCASKAQDPAPGTRSREPRPKNYRVVSAEEIREEPDPTPEQVAEWAHQADHGEGANRMQGRLMLAWWRGRLAERSERP